MGKPTDLLQGTLDLLILKTLALEPMHGWGITLRIQQISGDVLQVIKGRVTFAHRYFSSDFAMACESVERLTQYDVGTIAFSHYPAWTDDANGVLARLAKRAREKPKRP